MSFEKTKAQVTNWMRHKVDRNFATRSRVCASEKSKDLGGQQDTADPPVVFRLQQ
jgi:hypothetical protein